MARLVNLRQRVVCAACGVGEIIEESPEVADPRTTWGEYLQAMLAARGWRVLVGPPASLLLCKGHAAAYQDATVEELRVLRNRLLAFRVAERFALEFYVANGRVVTEKDERQATVPELEMWSALRRMIVGQAEP